MVSIQQQNKKYKRQAFIYASYEPYRRKRKITRTLLKEGIISYSLADQRKMLNRKGDIIQGRARGLTKYRSNRFTIKKFFAFYRGLRISSF